MDILGFHRGHASNQIILGIKVISKVQGAFGIRMELSEIFRHCYRCYGAADKSQVLFFPFLGLLIIGKNISFGQVVPPVPDSFLKDKICCVHHFDTTLCDCYECNR